MDCSNQFGQTAIRGAREGILSLSANLHQKQTLIEQLAELTIDSLSQLCTFITAVQHLVKGASGIIESCDTDQLVDTDGTLVPAIEEGERVFKRFVDIMQSKQKCAFEDPDLKGSFSKRVISAYSRMIEALKMLHDACSDLRWAIIDHDAELAPVNPQTFTSANDLMRVVQGGRK